MYSIQYAASLPTINKVGNVYIISYRLQETEHYPGSSVVTRSPSKWCWPDWVKADSLTIRWVRLRHDAARCGTGPVPEWMEYGE